MESYEDEPSADDIDECNEFYFAILNLCKEKGYSIPVLTAVLVRILSELCEDATDVGFLTQLLIKGLSTEKDEG